MLLWLKTNALGSAACFTASWDEILWARFDNELGLRDILRALSSRDEELISQVALRIPNHLHMTGLETNQAEAAVSAFLDSPNWSAFAGVSPADSADPAETEDMELSNERREPSQGLRGLLYYIAEDDAKRKAYEHRGISCEECREQPIRGVRW